MSRMEESNLEMTWYAGNVGWVGKATAFPRVCLWVMIMGPEKGVRLSLVTCGDQSLHFYFPWSRLLGVFRWSCWSHFSQDWPFLLFGAFGRVSYIGSRNLLTSLDRMVIEMATYWSSWMSGIKRAGTCQSGGLLMHKIQQVCCWLHAKGWPMKI